MDMYLHGDEGCFICVRTGTFSSPLTSKKGEAFAILQAIY